MNNKLLSALLLNTALSLHGITIKNNTKGVVEIFDCSLKNQLINPPLDQAQLVLEPNFQVEIKAIDQFSAHSRKIGWTQTIVCASEESVITLVDTIAVHDSCGFELSSS